MVFILTLATGVASEARTNLYSAASESTQIEDESSQAKLDQPTTPPGKSKRSPSIANEGTLAQRSWSMIGRGQSILVGNSANEVLEGFKIGEIINGKVPITLIAFSEGKAPVVAQITHNDRDYLLLGDATLERTSKRIKVDFTQIRERYSDKVFEVKAQALAPDGTLGLEGELHTGEAQYFVAELLSAAAAGFVDASINRTTNVLGNQIEERSLDTQMKKALGAAMLKSTERFGEKARSAPQYSVLEGPVPIKLLIGTGPTRKGSR